MVGKSLLKDIPQVDLQGKVVLVRVDFNVPLAETTSGIRVGDDSRIKASLPTIVYLTESSAKVILCSHLGRPRGKCLPGLSLQPVAEVLKTYGVAVQFVNECIGQPVQDAVCSLKDGHVLLLENLRFHIEETNNDDAFSKELAAGVDIYVDDAFGTAHRGTHFHHYLLL